MNVFTGGRLGKAMAQCREELAEALIRARAAEEALAHSTDVLRAMVSALPVGVITIDRHGRVELWNQAAETILGYTAEEMVGKPSPTHVFTPNQRQQASAADVFLRMVTGQMVRGEEVQCRRRDGSLVETSLSGAPLLGEDDRLRGAICVFEDISHRKAMAVQLQQAQKMEAVGQLTGGLAHDFNNILGVAIGNLDLLEAEVADSPRTAELLETALSALLRGADLTRALLAFSRRQPLQPARIDTAALLTSSARMLTRALGEHIKVGLRVDGDLWPVVVDAAQLESAITNLAINARDAMPSGGNLGIAARNVELDEDYAAHNAEVTPGEYVLIEISDNGTGIAPEALARVFEPFFTTKPVGQGTGLGLSMVFGFIKQSGGHIRIYSELGIGTTVRLYFPRAEEGSDVGPVRASGGAIRGGDETVLVVEDNEDVRRMVRNQLTEFGYRVLVAEHGPAAMVVLGSDSPIDLLFTDVVMPEGMTGFVLADEALRVRPGLKVLITSGFPGDAFHKPSTGAAQWAFLSKPYRKRDLARAVRDALDGKGAIP